MFGNLNKTLSPLMEFTDTLSGEDYVSLSYLKPVLHLLNNTVLAYSEDDTDLTKHMKTAILQYLNDKYSDPATNDLLDMASFADPRFKDSYIAEDRKDYIKTRAAAEIQALLVMQAEAVPASESPPRTSTAAAGGAVERESKKVKESLGSFFKKASTQPGPAALSDRDAIEVEIKSYLQSVEVDAEANPLEWWRLHQTNFPRLANLAKKYLCIPATSAPSERAFSTGGNIVTCQRLWTSLCSWLTTYKRM